MGSPQRSMALSLGVLLLASCAGSSIDNKVAAPQVEPAVEEAADATNIVVTGSRISPAQQ